MAESRSDEDARRLGVLLDSIEHAIIGTDAAGRISSWNVAAERLFEHNRDDALGQDLALITPLDRRQEQDAILAAVLGGEHVAELDTVRLRRDGSPVFVALDARPIQAASGTVIGVWWILRDVAGHVASELSARRLAAIVASSDDAIVSKDLQGIVTSWNRAAEEMFGYPAAEMVGRSIRLIIPDDRQAEEDNVLAHIRRGEKIDHFETIRRRKDGALVPISLSVSPIVDQRGTVIGASKIARDISERKQVEAERAQLLQRTRADAQIAETLNRVGSAVASTLERDTIVQAVTDAARTGTGAEFGAFFYNVLDERSGSATQLYIVSGAPKEAFAHFTNPRETLILGPTCRGDGPVRVDDLADDPRFCSMPPRELPEGLALRSFLAVPVKSRSGDVLGCLFFGHSQTGQFSAEHERLALGIATWASVALENARLYESVQIANHLKDEFLATLSHELRTPLNAILGYARMMRSGVTPPEQYARAVETIERNGMSLAQMVEDILDVSRIITGKIRLNVQPIELPSVLRGAVDAVVPAAAAKGVRIEVKIDPRTTKVSGDPERLQQVAWNLISNAVKFTPHGGTVQVRLERDEPYVELIVSDTGVGISADFLPYIFERFRQAEAGPNRERGGLGLGLGIARQLVELHGGTIDVDSPGAGQGATFRVKLPLARTRHHGA